MVVVVVWCLLSGGLGVGAGAQSGVGSPVPGVPPVGVGGGLEAGQVDGAVGSGAVGFVGVVAERGSPPLDGSLGEGLGRLDVSGAGVPVSGQGGGVPGPVAEVFGGGFLEAPVVVVPEEGPAPEGFGGLAMCAGGTVCGSAQILPAPTGLSCSVTASVIVFSWNAVSGGDDYTAKLQLGSGQGGQTVRTTSSTSVVFAGLSSSTRYYIGVHSNVGGVAQYYSGVYCTTAVGRPWCGVVSASGVQLVWRADSRAHQWYAARAVPGGGHTDGRALAGSALSTVFTGLEANVSYTFLFWWRASAGGAWTQVHPSAVCTTTAPPAAPVVRCAATASTIAVSWDPVAGATRYRVSRGSGWAAAVGRSHVFSDLAGSTSYSVRVQGWNTAGWGQTGTRACTTEAAILPAPTGLGCEATSSQVRFSWDAVDGADSYSAKIQLAVAGSAQTEIPTGSTTVTFTGLVPSTRYWASVLAVKNSKAQHFAGVYCTTLADIAAPVLSCKATSTTATVSWEKVTGASKYRARAGDGAWADGITATTHTFTGLAPAEMFEITVQSGGPKGWGNAGKVRCVTAAPGVDCDQTTSNSVVLRWDGIDGAESWYAAISKSNGYIGGRTHGRHIKQGNTTEFTGLAKGTRYVMLLWWYDGDEWHPVSPPPECWTKPLDAPKITGHTTGGATLTIEWEPVEGAELYQASISPAGSSGAVGASEGGGWETVLFSGDSHTFTGLEPGAQYTVRIRAGTFAKASEASANGIAYQPESAETSARSNTSTVECKAKTATTIEIEWDDPDGDYQWRIARTTINQNADIQYLDTRTFAKGSSGATLTGLQPNTVYWISAWKRADTGQSWQPIEPSPRCSTEPSDLTIHQCPQTADTDGTVRWADNGATYYRITRDRNPAKPEWTLTNATSHTFTELAEETTYNIAVQAWTPTGWTTKTICDMKTLPPIKDGLVTNTGMYSFTKGTVKGVLHVAGQAISNRSGSNSTEQVVCGNPGTRITKIQLSAIMLSIPVHELSMNAPSPMSLSRWDNLYHQKQTHNNDTRSLNERLFANMQLRVIPYENNSENRGAHWSPGTGLWQLEILTSETKKMNHAQRADIRIGGLEVAKFLLAGYCRDVVNDSGLKRAFERWFDCNDDAPDECYNTYVGKPTSIYSSNKLNIRINSLEEVDGGIREQTCRWTSNKSTMPCYLYDLATAQGYTSDYQYIEIKENENTKPGKIDWTLSTTPLPMAFLSFTDDSSGNRFAVWPKKWPSTTTWEIWPSESVSPNHTVIRAVRGGEVVRCSPGRDSSPESSDPKIAAADCAEETYKPFGSEISNHNFSADNMIVEGWFNDSVPYRDGNTEQDRHKLQVESCELYALFGSSVVHCKWIDL